MEKRIRERTACETIFIWLYYYGLQIESANEWISVNSSAGDFGTKMHARKIHRHPPGRTIGVQKNQTWSDDISVVKIDRK